MDTAIVVVVYLLYAAICIAFAIVEKRAYERIEDIEERLKRIK